MGLGSGIKASCPHDCRVKANCLHVGHGLTGEMGSVKGFLRDSNQYFSEFS